MPIILQGTPTISVGDTDTQSIDLQDYLDEGETFTGTPTVVELTTAHLTLSNKAFNASEITVAGREVAIGMAIQFKVSGQQAGMTYRIQSTGTTTAGRTVTMITRFSAV